MTREIPKFSNLIKIVACPDFSVIEFDRYILKEIGWKGYIKGLIEKVIEKDNKPVIFCAEYCKIKECQDFLAGVIRIMKKDNQEYLYNAETDERSEVCELLKEVF